MARNTSVVIISTRVDTSTDAVVRELDRRGVECTRFNTDEYPYNAQITTHVEEHQASTSLATQTHSSDVLDNATGIWFRRLRTPSPPANMAKGVHEYCINEARAALVGSLLGVRSRVMSHPHVIWRAEHKVEQLRLASKIGLKIPRTTVTNDPEEVKLAYNRSGGRLVVKPVRRGYVCLDQDDERAVYTSLVEEEHLERVASAQMAPAIYQHLVDKSCDVRATFVDGDLFVAEIDSQRDVDAKLDWRRTSDPDLPHRPATLPDRLETSIQRLMASLDLRFGAIDFVLTPDGDYLFLEVNPNGQWLWLDDQLNFGISGKIAEWLAGAN